MTAHDAQRRRRAGALFAAATAAGLAMAAAGCSGVDDAAAGPPPSPTAPPTTRPALPPASQLAALAALGQDRYYRATFRFTPADGSAPGHGQVQRTRSGVRFDLTEPAGGGSIERTTVMVQTGAGAYACRLTAGARGCVAAGETTPVGPSRMWLAFTDWLGTLADPDAAISVAAAPAPPGGRGTCFSVEGVAAALEPPVDPGLYCLDSVGNITVLKLAVGAITITEVASAPPTVVLPAPLVAVLPSAAAPSPTPPTTPSTS